MARKTTKKTNTGIGQQITIQKLKIEQYELH